MGFLKALNISQTVYYIYGGLCTAFVIYKTIDPRGSWGGTGIGRFFKALLIVLVASFLIGLIGTLVGAYLLQNSIFH